MSSELSWLDDDFNGYGPVQLDNQEIPQENLILKTPPEIPAPEKFTLKKAFDVDTQIVVERLKKAIWPIKGEEFFDKAMPDLYTPFWIVTTLILVIFVVSMMENQDVSVIIKSSSLIYMVSAGVPAALYFLISQSGYCEFYKLLSFYGYSFIHFVIAGLMSVYANWIFRVLVWTLAGGLSLFFLYKNLKDLVIGSVPNQKFIALGIVVAGHISVIITTNLFFL
ncbi:hypothetical protein SteCoe_8580 [Stentor coeruleus]|uniref:Protein YIPF n=1 Tax=Stentor coeruleus TaxID=5963 RepID=A0A1R2CJW4_9CILI|nr:hypothetical protein SteCoe_8580 [Stentor coeruleus]